MTNKPEDIRPTGKFPEGKLSPDDEGELTIGITEWCGHVRIDFGSPIQSLAMPPDKAVELAKYMIEKAINIKGKAAK